MFITSYYMVDYLINFINWIILINCNKIVEEYNENLYAKNWDDKA